MATRKRIIYCRRYHRWLRFYYYAREGSPPKPLKPYTAFSIPVEVNDDLNAYLDNISNRKALKRFSAAAVRAWFRSRGYDKQ